MKNLNNLNLINYNLNIQNNLNNKNKKKYPDKTLISCRQHQEVIRIAA